MMDYKKSQNTYKIKEEFMKELFSTLPARELRRKQL